MGPEPAAAAAPAGAHAEAANGGGRGRRAALAALFALSGCASLMDQVVWLRYLSLSFGNTTHAAATLLAVFLGGLALGALAFGRLADRLRRPLAVFAVVEIGVALIALASPQAFALIDAVYVALYRAFGSQPALFAAGRALLAAAILLPPTVLMGGTLPLILRAVVPAGERERGGEVGRREVGRASALFYAVNTLGATAGVALAGVFTIRLLGLTATLVLAAGFDLMAGLGCALLSRPLPGRGGRRAGDAVPAGAGGPEPATAEGPAVEPGAGPAGAGERGAAVLQPGPAPGAWTGREPARGSAPPATAPRATPVPTQPPERAAGAGTGAPALARGPLLALFFAMGATSLAYEVLWTRILVFYLGSSVYAYSLMLLAILLGIGCGSLLAAPWVRRLRSPLAALAAVEAGIGLWALAQVFLFERLNASFVIVAEALTPGSFAGISAVQFIALLPILLPPTLLMGASFPLAVRAASRGAARVGGDVGAVYGANTLGAVAGALAAGFGLVPWLGTQASLLAIGAANAALGAVIAFAGGRWEGERGGRPGARRTARRALRWAWLVPPAAILAAIPWLPAHTVVLSAGIFRHDRPGDLLDFDEDSSATVTVRRVHTREGEPWLSLELNGVNVAGTTPENFAVQKLQGHLPMLLLPERRGAAVAHIGLGSGATAHAVSLHPVDRIRVIEISPAVPRAAERWFRPINGGVLADPRLALEINDGRNFMLATRERFDAILSDSIHPRYAGNGSLYSLEYFRLLRRRLEPGGAVSMWLPMYSLTPANYRMVLAAFADAFPNTAVWYEPSALNSFTVVTASTGEEPWHAPTLAAAFADPVVGGELASLGLAGPADLLACQLLSGDALDEWLAGVPPHQDDLPAVEYESGSLLARNWTWLATFDALLDRRPAAPPENWLATLPAEERARAGERWQLYGRWMAAHLDYLRRQLGGGAGGDFRVGDGEAEGGGSTR